MSDFLTDEEQMTRLQNWWNENGVRLIVLTAIAIAAFVGWRWYEQDRVEKAQAASAAYEKFVASPDDATFEAAGKLIDERHAGSSYQVFALLRRAQKAVVADDLAQAQELLTSAVDESPDASFADLARLRLARVQAQLADDKTAMATLRQIRSIGFRASVAELTGDIHLRAGETELAHAAYQQGVDELLQGDVRRVLEMKAANTAPPQQAGNADATDAIGQQGSEVQE